MANYTLNGVQYTPALTWDNALNFVLGKSTASGTPLTLVANPNGTTPVEAFTLSTGGTLTFGAFTASTAATFSGAVTFSTAATFSGAVTFSTGVSISTGGLTIATGGQQIRGFFVTSVAYSPAAVPISSSTANRVEKVTVTGLTTNDRIVNFEAPPSYAWPGIAIGQCYVTSSGALGVPWINTTTAAVTPSTGTFLLTYLRSTVATT